MNVRSQPRIFCPVHSQPVAYYFKKTDTLGCEQCIESYDGNVPLQTYVSWYGMPNFTSTEFASIQRSVHREYLINVESLHRQACVCKVLAAGEKEDQLIQERHMELQMINVKLFEYNKNQKSQSDETQTSKCSSSFLTQNAAAEHELMRVFSSRDVSKPLSCSMLGSSSSSCSATMMSQDEARRVYTKLFIKHQEYKIVLELDFKTLRKDLWELVSLAHLNLSPHKANISSHHLGFCSIEGVNRLRDVDMMEEYPATHLLADIHASECVSMRLIIPSVPWSSATLSTNGILGGFSSTRHQLLFFDILHDSIVKVSIDTSYAAVGYFEDQIIVAADGKSLKAVSLDGFLNGDGGNFKQLAHPIVRGKCDLSRIWMRREIWFSGVDRQLVEFHLDTRKYKKHSVLTTSIIPILGCGLFSYRCVVRLLDGRVGFLRQNMSMDLLSLPSGVSEVYYVIPSDSQPEDPGSLLVICAGPKGTMFFSKGEYGCAPPPLDKQESLILVRLFRDIFMFYNVKKRRWEVLRIKVK